MIKFYLISIFFCLIFNSFFFASPANADQERKIKDLKKEIVQEIIKAAPDLKIGAPSISEERLHKLEDPEFSQYIKEFCPNMNYQTLKTKWDQNIKVYNQKMDLVKKKGAAAVNWRAPNLGKNSFTALSGAAFENNYTQQISVPSLVDLKTFLDNRLREIYPQCDFKMTRQPQSMSQKIINERKFYLKDLSKAHPERVLDSEMVELKVFDPPIAGSSKSMRYVNVVAHGYKIRFEAPGKNIVRSPLKVIFSIKLLNSGYYLRDMQELNPDSKVTLPPSEIQRAKMDKYTL